MTQSQVVVRLSDVLARDYGEEVGPLRISPLPVGGIMMAVLAALLAMASQRQELIAGVDRLSKAIGSFGRLCAFVRGLSQEPDYDFEQRGQKDLALVEVHPGCPQGAKEKAPVVGG